MVIGEAGNERAESAVEGFISTVDKVPCRLIKLIREPYPYLQVDRVEERARKLEEKVRFMMMNSSDLEPLNLLELIDDLHRLGLSYKFQNHINSALSRIHSSQYMHRLQRHTE
ncbi:hypothetical protein HN51_028629 [Arachis hypogaea]